MFRITGDCPQLAPPQFGSVVQTGRQVGDTATYMCDPGYELVGDEVRTCQQIDIDTTAFDGEQPVCRRMLSYSDMGFLFV